MAKGDTSSSSGGGTPNQMSKMNTNGTSPFDSSQSMQNNPVTGGIGPGQPAGPGMNKGLGPAQSVSSPTTSNGTLLGTTGGSSMNLGGGWGQFATNPNTPQGALYSGFQRGQSGQSLIDQLNQNPATSGVAYYADRNQYGIPGGYYAAPNANGGAMDLIQRGGGGESSGGGMVGGGIDMSQLMPLLQMLLGGGQQMQNRPNYAGTPYSQPAMPKPQFGGAGLFNDMNRQHVNI